MEREHDTTIAGEAWSEPAGAAPGPARERGQSEADTPLMTGGQRPAGTESTTTTTASETTASEMSASVTDHGRARADDVPSTGDPTIDAVLSELAEARNQPLEAHIAAGEKAHRVLQARLSDLAGE